MSAGASMGLPVAQAVAANLRRRFEPHCDRVLVVGSVRREMRFVRDIELLVIPRTEGDAGGQPALFAGAPVEEVLPLHDAVTAAPDLRPVKPGSGGEPDDRWPQKRAAGESRYWRLHHAGQGCQVDVFLVSAETWGVQCLIRTGPAEFSRWAVTRWIAVSDGGRVVDGRLHPPSRVHPPPCYGPAGQPLERPVETPEERDAFRYLNIPWIEPRDRMDWRLRLNA